MYCHNCGVQLQDGLTVCPNCSTTLVAPTVQQQNQLVQHQKQTTKNKTLIKVLLLVAILCFFLPFVTVSCGSSTVSANGFEIATGQFSDEYLMDEGYPLNIFVLVSLCSTTIALICSFVKKNNWHNTVIVWSLIAAISILCFSLFFAQYYGLDTSDLETLTIEYEIGYWICIVLNVLSVVVSFISKPPKTLDTNTCQRVFDYLP